MDRSVIRYVKEIQDGNEQAFDDLFHAIYEDVFRMAYSITHNQADANDVTQEVFISMYENIYRLKDVEAFPLWVQRIVFTRCTRLFRKRKEPVVNENHMRTLSYEVEKDKDFLPKEKFDDEKEVEVMHELVMRLQPKHQDVVYCVYFKQMSLKETAKYLNRPEGTIKSQLYAARKELYGYVKDYEQKNHRKIKFYDWGTPMTTSMFSLTQIKNQFLLLKSKMMFWQTSMIISSMVMGIACVGTGVNIHQLYEQSNENTSNVNITTNEKIHSTIIEKAYDTPQDAYFTLVNWGISPEIAKQKDPQEIAQMRYLMTILSDDQGVYWDRFITEGWLVVFE